MRLRVFVRIISISIDGFQTINLPADVAELADALASGASGGNPVEVQILSSALLGLSLKTRGLPAMVLSNDLGKRSPLSGLTQPATGSLLPDKLDSPQGRVS